MDRLRPRCVPLPFDAFLHVCFRFVRASCPEFISFVLTPQCAEEAKANLALFVVVPAQHCDYTACILVIPVQDNPCLVRLNNNDPTELQRRSTY